VDAENIHLVTTKNRKSVTVPLLDEAMAVWRKYGGRLPRMSNQKQNEYLKELMKRAGINKEMVVVDFRGAERIEKVVQKCDLIGTHTAKRTYVSILRRRGISVETIMKITGNTRRTIERYILTDEEDVGREIKAAWNPEPALRTV
jgi:F420-0:gamma-glutamyl ligase-like protein